MSLAIDNFIILIVAFFSHFYHLLHTLYLLMHCLPLIHCSNYPTMDVFTIILPVFVRGSPTTVIVPFDTQVMRDSAPGSYPSMFLFWSGLAVLWTTHTNSLGWVISEIEISM